MGYIRTEQELYRGCRGHIGITWGILKGLYMMAIRRLHRGYKGLIYGLYRG